MVFLTLQVLQLPPILHIPHAAMIDLESKFEVLETEVKEINTNKETLKKNLLDLIELQHILDKTRGFFQEVRKCSHYTCAYLRIHGDILISWTFSCYF